MRSRIAALMERRGVRQFVKFGIVGASGFIVNLVVFTVLQRLDPQHTLALHYDVLYSIGFLAGGVSNYWLNRVWTFRSSGHAVREGVQFLTVSVIALIFGLIVSAMVAPFFGHGHRTWFVGTVAGIFVNFFVNKYWTFKGAPA
ncbi:MAG TPA: GtrA family protein [Candidatus Baltobacteraceae bacterium]|nr:GtrA family protein [Candidatus Baltobacteraceae bacterium]